MTFVSLWDWFLIRLGLRPKPPGLTPVLHPQSALLLKGMSAAAVVVGIVGSYAASLWGSGLLDSRDLWETQGKLSGHEARRRFVESRFTPEARAAIQRIHDRLQLGYGDGAYRYEFKPRVAQATMQGYLEEVLAGSLKTPGQYLREMSPEDIERLSTMAIGDLNGDGVTSSFQLQGQPDWGQARTAPAMSETDPDE